VAGGQEDPGSGVRQDIHVARDALSAGRDLTVHNYYATAGAGQPRDQGRRRRLGAGWWWVISRSSRRGSSRGQACWRSWRGPGQECWWCVR
jgi:hypothetical protein